MPDYTPPSGASATAIEDDSGTPALASGITEAEIRTLLNLEASDIVAAVESESDSNTFTDADHSKLNGIAASATAYSDADALAAIRAADPLISGTTTDVALTIVNNKSTGLDDTETATLRLQCNQGTDSDFEIVHDVFGHTTLYSNQPDSGTNAHIKFTDTPAVVVNPNAMDMDFQVASDSVSNMLYVNAGTDSVGIGTNVPSSRLDVRGGLTTEGSVLSLSTMETTVVANDVLGRINFQAPLEASGTDAISPGASIHALATDTFAANNNETAIVLSTASSDAEGTAGGGLNERMRITSAGKVGIGTSSPAATLDVQGSARFRASVEVCTSDPAPANIETGTIYQFTKGSAGVFTLPADPPVGTQFVLVNGDGQDIVITRPHSSVKINGATSNATNTTAYAATSIVAVVSNGNNSEWLAFGGI